MQQVLTGGRPEAEHKYMLDEHEYYRLMNALEKKAGRSRKKIQTNYYFDTEEFKLYNSNESIRIRNLDNTYTVTYKSAPAENSSGNYLERNEYEIKIDAATAEKMILNDSSALKLFPALIGADRIELKCMGQASTERTEFYILSSPILLDKTDYLGITDFELEYEVTGGADDSCALIQLLEHYTIQTSLNVVSKSARFFMRLSDLNVRSSEMSD